MRKCRSSGIETSMVIVPPQILQFEYAKGCTHSPIFTYPLTTLFQQTVRAHLMKQHTVCVDLFMCRKSLRACSTRGKDRLEDHV
jgi:hypothetical protein